MTEAISTPDPLALLEHRAWVRALARRLCADENDVDDVEQDTWTVAMRTRPEEPRALRSWLGVVASRLALQRMRGETRRARRQTAIAAAATGDERPTADVVAEADAHGHVVQAVLALDEPYRTTVLLRYFEGLEIADVARRMSTPVETVRTRLKRAHERLRGSLGPDRDRALVLLAAPGGATAASAPAVASGAAAAGTFAFSSAVVAGVVALGAGGAWLVTNPGDDDGPRGDANGPLVAAAPQDGGAGGAGGGANRSEPGRSGEAGKPGEPGTTPQQETPAAPPTPPAGDPWIAYDLADGRPLAGFTLKIVIGDRETAITTDAAGRVDTDRAKVTSVAADPPWTFAKPTKGEVKDEPSLWFWRERPVTGTVTAADPAKPLDPSGVQFTWVLPWSMTSMTVRDEPGRGALWLRAHDFERRRDLPNSVHADATGRLSGSAPAIRGAMLVAEAGGFTPAPSPLVWNGDGVCVLTITLAPSLQIVGRVLDENGNAVVGGQVRLDTSIDAATEEDASRAQAMPPRGGRIGSGGPGKWVVALVDQTTTDARGIFRFDAPAVGTQVVYVMQPGYLTARRQFAEGANDTVGFEMRLARSDVRVLIRDAGVPLTSAEFSVQVADGRENGFLLTTDKDGVANSGWLQRGRWYRISRRDDPTPGRSGCLLWDGQTEIDLARLPKKPDDGK